MFSRFPIHVSVAVQGGYDDNVNTTPTDPQGSGFVNATLLLDMKVGTPRTNLELTTNTGFNYFFASVDNQYEPNLNLTLTVQHKASPRLVFDVSAYFSYQTEPNFEAGIGTNRRNGNYFLTQDHLAVTYLWLPRFATRTSYDFVGVNYDNTGAFDPSQNVTMGPGVFEDRVEQTFGNEFRFLVWPTTNLVAQYRFQVVNYAHEGEVIFIPRDILGNKIGPAVRLQRDSTTQFLLGGFDQAFTPRLNGSFRGGAEFRDYDASGETSSPYFEANLSYRLGKDTSLNWTNHYGIEEGDVAQSQTRKSFRTGVSGQHNLTSRVTASLAVYYWHDDYEPLQSGTTVNPGFTEESFDINLSLAYALSQHLNAQLGYDHTEVSSGAGDRDYSRNRVWAGFNFAF